MSTWPEPDRPDTPRTPPDERTSMETWLDYHRNTLLKKCAGLTPEQLATRSCLPSSLSLLGLVRHMTDVESWFHDYSGEPPNFVYYTKEDPDADFDGVDPARADSALAAYQASIERSRATVAGVGLDELTPDTEVPAPTSLRWVYMHMIEEYARHNGHADLIRERIDGMTGD